MEVVIFKKLQQYMHSVETGFMGMTSQEMFHAPENLSDSKTVGWGCPVSKHMGEILGIPKLH